jgi:hypothetical protein
MGKRGFDVAGILHSFFMGIVADRRLPHLFELMQENQSL